MCTTVASLCVKVAISTFERTCDHIYKYTHCTHCKYYVAARCSVCTCARVASHMHNKRSPIGVEATSEATISLCVYALYKLTTTTVVPHRQRKSAQTRVHTFLRRARKSIFLRHWHTLTEPPSSTARTFAARQILVNWFHTSIAPAQQNQNVCARTSGQDTAQNTHTNAGRDRRCRCRFEHTHSWLHHHGNGGGRRRRCGGVVVLRKAPHRERDPKNTRQGPPLERDQFNCIARHAFIDTHTHIVAIRACARHVQLFCGAHKHFDIIYRDCVRAVYARRFPPLTRIFVP